jgi:L,D-transpeptidase-like protein
VKWLLAIAGLAVAAIVVAAVLFQAGDEAPEATGTGERLVRVRLPEDADALRIEARRVSLYDRPRGRLIGSVDRKTEFGSPEFLQIVRRQGEWVAVRHTSLGNHRIGWVKVRPSAISWHEKAVSLEVDLSERQLTVKAGGAHLRRIAVAVGAPDTPTPPGEFYVTDKLRGADFGEFYGCCILALSGHQPNLPQGWSGGDRLAIHGSPTPTWGQNVSNGCFHAREADLRYLLRTVSLGTVVTVRA